MTFRFLKVTSLVLLLASADVLGQDQSIPKFDTYVTDLTETLTGSERSSLEKLLDGFDKQTSTQIVVLVVSTVPDGSIEEFAIRVAEVNKIGREEKDNGILLVIAKEDRNVRIEVGYGLEGVLTDALSGIIVRREIIPHFKSGDYYAGILAGIEAIIAVTKDEYKADEDEGTEPIAFLPILILLVIVFFALRNGRRGPPVGPFGRGGIGPIGWGGGFPPSRGGGGWGSGGGFGGGFGGGGGSFGGGGASGRW